MVGDGGALLQGAQTALAAGEWSAAQERFEAALAVDDIPEAWFGLGVALWWQHDTAGSVSSWEHAFVGFRHRADADWAVLAAFYLCLSYRMSLGNDAASRGWLHHAVRLLDEVQSDVSEGWVRLAQAYVANESRQPVDGERWARKTLEIAREVADADLELCGLSELGAALVESGRVQEGAPLLDEAMARALAGEGELDAVVLISCRTITSCSRGGEVRRATQWIHAADEFQQRHGSPHLYMTCRTEYGGILLATGEWEQAEEELDTALAIGRAAEPALHARALAMKAELRTAQGRLDDAERLLGGIEEDDSAVIASATLHLARGRPAAASRVLERGLRDVADDALEAAALHELLCEAEVALGAVHEAAERAHSLLRLGAHGGSTLVQARGERATGRVLHALDVDDEAVDHLERAFSLFASLQMPFEVSRTRMSMAHALAAAQQDTAVVEARTALARFDELGAARDADAAAAFLRTLGVRAMRSAPRNLGGLTSREREVLVLLGEGLSNPEMAERLFISRKTVEHHVASVLAKLGLRGRSEAAAYAVRRGGRESAGI